MSGDRLYPEARLQLFAKAPVPGRVKSRLRGAWGARGACGVYQQLFRETLATAVTSAAAPVEVWAAPSAGHPWLRARTRDAGASLRVQAPGDLGARMAHGLRTALVQSPYAVIIGADCAALTPWHIREAFARLADGDDAVFCPARDGGYLLVGVRRMEFELFRAIPWGTSAVMRDTRQRLRRLRWQASELPVAIDVDRPEDVHALRRAGRLPAPGGGVISPWRARARSVPDAAG